MREKQGRGWSSLPWLTLSSSTRSENKQQNPRVSCSIQINHISFCMQKSQCPKFTLQNYFSSASCTVDLSCQSFAPEHVSCSQPLQTRGRRRQPMLHFWLLSHPSLCKLLQLNNYPAGLADQRLISKHHHPIKHLVTRNYWLLKNDRVWFYAFESYTFSQLCIFTATTYQH